MDLGGNIVARDEEKAEKVLNAFFASVLGSKMSCSLTTEPYGYGLMAIWVWVWPYRYGLMGMAKDMALSCGRGDLRWILGKNSSLKEGCEALEQDQQRTSCVIIPEGLHKMYRCGA